MRRSIACLLALGACGGRQNTDALEERIRQLEADVVTLKARPEPKPEPRPRAEPAVKRPPPPEEPGLAKQVGELTAKVAALEANLDNVWVEIERGFGDVRAEDLAKARAPGQRPQPRPDVAYSVPITGNATDQKNDDNTAKVTWVIGMEMTEPYTRRLLETAAKLRAAYGSELRIAYKPFIVHEWGVSSAMLLCAAQRQDKFLEALDAMKAIDLRDKTHFRLGPLRASLHMLDRAKVDADLAGPCRKQVRDDHAFAVKMNMTGVPYSFVNGRYLGGAMGEDQFKALIDEELARADAELKGGPSKGYYDKLVKRGAPSP